jgi:Fur family ferric uptake transcriptional regulator
MIVNCLFEAGAPVSAQQIAAGLIAPLDLASVYRNLETLEEHGVVRHFHAGHGAGRYVLVGGGEREYLACDRCGSIAEVDRSGARCTPRGTFTARFGFGGRLHTLPDGGPLPALRSAAGRVGIVSFDFLFQPVEQLDVWLEGLFAGAPLLVALLIALVLGLRHAPIRITSWRSPRLWPSTVATFGARRGSGPVGSGTRDRPAGAGIPLILFKSSVPAWIERAPRQRSASSSCSSP